MQSFKGVLLQTLGSPLSELGYQYEERLRNGNHLYGFQKSLGGGVYATIVFQRQHAGERAYGYGFTIELGRGMTNDYRTWKLYEGSFPWLEDPTSQNPW